MGDLRHLWTDAYLAALREHGLLGRAAIEAGVDRVTVYHRRKDDPEFEARVREAIEHAADSLEREARRRALEGTEKGVWHQGVLVGTERVYSDAMLALLLKGRRKDVFADRTELTGADGGPVRQQQVTVVSGVPDPVDDLSDLV
jgi:hypothetical protein